MASINLQLGSMVFEDYIDNYGIFEAAKSSCIIDTFSSNPDWSIPFAYDNGTDVNFLGDPRWISFQPFNETDSSQGGQFSVNGFPSNASIAISITSLPSQNTSLQLTHLKEDMATVSTILVLDGTVATGQETNWQNGNVEYMTFIGVNTSCSDNTLGRIKSNQVNGVYAVDLEIRSCDYAEYLPKRDVKQTLRPGDIVGIDGQGRISLDTSDAQQILVISTAPGVVGGLPREEEKDGYGVVGMLGQVPTKVRGRVNPGDVIVASGLSDGVGFACDSKTMRGSTDLYRRMVGVAWVKEPITVDDEEISHINLAVGLPTKNFSAALFDQTARHLCASTPAPPLELFNDRRRFPTKRRHLLH